MIVLDTHAWLWWVAKPQVLSKSARTKIERASSVGVSAISLWEVSMLAARDRIELKLEVRDWLEAALDLPKVTLLPLTPGIAAKSAELELHGDPADRLIVATAMVHAVPLVTKDERIRAFAGVVCIW